MTLARKPLLMGVLMGPMMLWMLHGQLTQNTVSIWAGVVFIAAHVLILLVLGAGAIFAARLSPRLRGWLARLHRPSVSHFSAMLLGMLASGAVVHLSLHGIV
jgi:hypothetical protein